MSAPEFLPPESPEQQQVPPGPPPNTVFRGPNGLRAGWRALLFLAIVAAIPLTLTVLIGIVFGLLHRGGPRPSFGASGLTPLGLSISEGAILLDTVAAAFIMARIERRRFGVYGLPLRSAFGKDFWIGLVVGFVAISGSLLGIFSFH